MLRVHGGETKSASPLAKQSKTTVVAAVPFTAAGARVCEAALTLARQLRGQLQNGGG